jgi:DNA-directed RNA polymerase specialized sigma24 family protein
MISPQVADQLWNQSYHERVVGAAHRAAWMTGNAGAWEDLAQDIAVDVWMPLIQKFDVGLLKDATDPQAAFGAAFQTMLNWYLADLHRNYKTQTQTQIRETQPLDEEVGEIPSSSSHEHLEQSLDFDSMTQRLEPELEDIVRFMDDWWSTDHPELYRQRVQDIRMAMWKEIARRWGMDKKDVIRWLARSPAFVQYMDTARGTNRGAAPFQELLRATA